MVVRVDAIYDGGTHELTRDSQSGLWSAQIETIKRDINTSEKYTYHPIIIKAIDDAGNTTVKTIADSEIGEDLLLVIREEDLFPMRFIVANERGEELEYIKAANKIDVDTGEENDFEITMSLDEWDPQNYNYGYRAYIPGTEYGGLLEERETSTKDNIIKWTGYTWRGLLEKKIIQPPAGQSYLIVSGEANSIMKQILGSRFGSLFAVEDINSEITISNYKFDRYCTVLEGFEKMLATKGARLKIYYARKEGIGVGAVYVSAVPAVDWSDYLEYSQDGHINFTTKDCRRGINHLICAGEGEGADRAVIHLYVQKDGTIGETQYYYGQAEREALYSYTSQEDTGKLKEDGTKRLKELMNYEQMAADITDTEVDIGDIVGGRDRITGMEIKQPIVGKVLRLSNETAEVEYKLKGEKQNGV